MIRAIETRYKGYRFRSRLEARWAVFFDALGIRWEYEHEGFVLSDGSYYLPDFWLPTFDGGLYVEVKPEDRDFEKARLFSATTGHTIWLAHGTPRPFAWTVVFSGCQEYRGIPNADQAHSEDRMFICPGYENEDGSIPPQWLDLLGDHYHAAVAAARGARFEHGERVV